MSICVGSWLQSGGPTHWRCRQVVVNDYNELIDLQRVMYLN